MKSFCRTVATAVLLVVLLSACAALQDAPTAEDDDSRYAARLQLAQLTADAGDVTSASRLFETLIRDEPDRPDGWLGLGDLHLRSGDLVNAEANFLGASRTSPDDPRPLAGLGRTALTRLEIATALRWLDEALLVDPHHRESLNAKAVALDLSARHGEAQSIYETILLEEPANLKARNNYALSLMLDESLGEATELLGELSRVDGGGDGYVTNLALIYAVGGQTQPAKSLFLSRLNVDMAVENLCLISAMRRSAGRQTASLSSPDCPRLELHLGEASVNHSLTLADPLAAARPAATSAGTDDGV